MSMNQAINGKCGPILTIFCKKKRVNMSIAKSQIYLTSLTLMIIQQKKFFNFFQKKSQNNPLFYTFQVERGVSWPKVDLFAKNIYIFLFLKITSNIFYQKMLKWLM